MRSLKRFFARLSHSATSRRDDQRLQEEIEEHLALQTADNLRAGLSPTEARRQAVLKFGAEAIREQYSAERGLAFLETLLRDLHFGWRSLRKPPGFTAVAVATLALGTPRRDPVVVLSYRRKARFHGDAGVLGKAAYVKGRPVAIVGLAPKGFTVRRPSSICRLISRST